MATFFKIFDRKLWGSYTRSCFLVTYW